MGELQQLQSGESIEQKTRQARQKLRDLITHLKKGDQIGSSCAHGLSPLAVTDVLERLSENQEVRDEILTQLGDICEAADDLLDILLGNRENRDLIPGPVSEEEPMNRDEVHMILEQLHILEDAARDTGINLRARDCPFCDEWAEKLGSRSVTSARDDQGVVVSNVRFKRHVATHQEQLAIFALPRAIEEDEPLDKEVVLNSNSGSESIRGSTDDEDGQHSLHREEPYMSQLQENLETENENYLIEPWSYEPIYDGDPVSDGPDVEPLNSRALLKGLTASQVPLAPESMVAQFSSKVSSSTQKKHKCKVCDKRFTRPSSLQTHMYSHTGEKLSNLWRHRKVHRSDAHLEEGYEDTDGDHSQNLPKRIFPSVSFPTSTISPGATSNPVFASDIQTSPTQQDSEPNSQIPFAAPLHPTPKTYRSQVYSVGQLDPETTAMSLDSPVLQHPPSRPSMPSELANDGNTLGKDEGVEDGR
ncbi:hypothetical protein CDV36_006917 [Fusarium kuroshium]|uniref:C2H2-type domain-containing protein n=1 Tax=Fusarium kuroshium TaxID=2010991 RepID=A0A3M2S754_9HYPO|nr:hypothetical protein CDV36_006917 [Fusarium kuroshium]